MLNTIDWRKINYEMIFGYLPTGCKKSLLLETTYKQITKRLQNVVWNLTNNGLERSSEDKAFIESIPELDPSEIPPVDANSQLPEYFNEFVVPDGK